MKAGLVLAAILGVLDIGLIATGGDFPPREVALASAALGVITLVGVWLGWRGNRPALAAVIVARLLSALGAVPAFFAADVPAAAKLAAGAVIVATAVCVALLARGLRRGSPAPAA